MSLVVYKYPLPRYCEPGMRFDLEIPKGARFLRCETQHNEPMTWWEVDPHAEIGTRQFVYFCTGQEFMDVEPRRTYLGMFMLNDGTFVAHLYELNAPTNPFLSLINRP